MPGASADRVGCGGSWTSKRLCAVARSLRRAAAQCRDACLDSVFYRFPLFLNQTISVPKSSQMHQIQNIQSVQVIADNRNRYLPEIPGVYAFWWIGCRKKLMDANLKIVLAGPGGQLVNVEYGDWWADDLAYPCLYVGKSTNIRRRFGLHLKTGTSGRLHEPDESNRRVKPRTTSCQLRRGIEHIFPDESNPLSLIATSVGFSCRTDFIGNGTVERFFEEDRLVGTWRPWFNIDSER